VPAHDQQVHVEPAPPATQRVALAARVALAHAGAVAIVDGLQHGNGLLHLRLAQVALVPLHRGRIDTRAVCVAVCAAACQPQ